MTAQVSQNCWYLTAKRFFTFLFKTLFPVEIINADLMKRENKPYIVIANHRSVWDPLILMSVCPEQIRFLVKEELMQRPLLSKLAKKIDVIPVQRHASDIRAFRDCITALRNQCILGIFPEGTRYSGGSMESPEPGAAMLAMMQKVELLPVYISARPRLFHKTRVVVGEALASQTKITSENLAKFSDEIKIRYRELRAEASRRFYAAEE